MRGALAAARPTMVGPRVRAALTPGPRLRRRVALAAAAAVVLAALYTLWLRDSSLVAVDEVTITGLTTGDAEHVRSVLTSVARDMTTLHVDSAKLEQATSPFPVIDSLRVTPDFPNGLHIEVIEHHPSAILVVSGDRTPVAADGTILSDVAVEGSLPTIDGFNVPTGAKLTPGAALDAVQVAGAAPSVILERLESVAREAGARGVVVQVADGPEIVFGSTDGLRAKWAAAVRVLADEDSEGAAYLDVRIPERPTAGGLVVETILTPAPVGEADALAIPEAAVPVAPEAAPEAGLETPEPVAPAPAPTAPPVPVTPAPAVPDGDGGGATASPRP